MTPTQEVVTSVSRFAGPIEFYPAPWWWRTPHQRKRGPPYRLTPRQVSRLISDTEWWITRYSGGDYVLEEADCRDLLEKIRRGYCIEPCDAEMPLPDSDDSYNRFARRNTSMCLSWAELKERGDTRTYERLAGAQQADWEAARRARQLAKEADAKRLWEADEAKRAGATYWHNLSEQFQGQPLVRIRTGSKTTLLRDENEPWHVRFEPHYYYTVPETVAEILVRTAGSSRV